MVNVSKHSLPPKELNQLFSHLSKVVAPLNTLQTSLFLDTLLGEEERLMLAKRLAAIVMFGDGYSVYRVAETLHISTSTASLYKARYDTDTYAELLVMIKKDQSKFKEFVTIIDSILTLNGHLPRYGQAHI